jgi:outer membrane protein insertion porin family
VFEDSGPDQLAGLGVNLVRTTIGTITRPGRGSRLELGYEYVGPFGDFDFHSVSAEYTVFLTIAEDFLGRRSTLRLNTRGSYIFGGRAPTYERYYLGGRSFRGFEFRTVSPKGTNRAGQPTDDPIGGDWLFFAGAQYEFPLFQDALTAAVFVDTGTVLDEFGFDDYRVSVGAGVRIAIPQLGPVPIAIDLGFPIVKQDDDEEQILSFSAELPF